MHYKADRAEHPTCRGACLLAKALLISLLLLAPVCGNLLAQSAEEFTKIYDSYLAAVKTGSYEQASAFLALLELRRAGELSIEQAAPFAPIRVSRLTQDNNAEDERTAAWNARSA